MNVGVSVPLPAYLVDVGAMARTAERLGFESFWCAEHPFMPVRTTSRFPGSADGVIPEAYSHFVDPFVALAHSCSRRSWAPVLVRSAHVVPASVERTTLPFSPIAKSTEPAATSTSSSVWVDGFETAAQVSPPFVERKMPGDSPTAR